MKRSQAILLLIAVFKYFKGILLVIIGISALNLVHRDMFGTLMSVAADLHLNTDNRFFHRMLDRLLQLDPKRLEFIAAATFAYAAVFFVEGTGLFLRKRWAEYITAIVTASFIPIELYETFHHFTLIKVVTIVVNIAIVWYLVRYLRRSGK